MGFQLDLHVRTLHVRGFKICTVWFSKNGRRHSNSVIQVYIALDKPQIFKRFTWARNHFLLYMLNPEWIL